MAREYYELVARGFSSTPDPFAAATVRGNETELRTRKDGGEWVDEKGAVHSGACDPNPRVHSTSGSRARTYSTKIVTPLSHPNGEKLSRRIKRNVRIVAETRPSGGEIGKVEGGFSATIITMFIVVATRILLHDTVIISLDFFNFKRFDIFCC